MLLSEGVSLCYGIMHPMKIPIIAGCIALDNISSTKEDFEERFSESPGGSVLTSESSSHFGGNAGNIAVNLSRLGCQPKLVGVVGSDFTEYRRHLSDLGIDLGGVVELNDQKTASAQICTDRTGRQLILYCPGAGASDVMPPIEGNKNDLAILSSDDKRRIMTWVSHCRFQNLPFIFDPGATVDHMNSNDLSVALRFAQGLILNEAEMQIIEAKVSKNRERIAEMLNFSVITQGAEPCQFFDGQDFGKLPIVPAAKVLDTTGCGDGLRAGLICGLTKGDDLEQALKKGLVVASFVAEVKGGQPSELDVKKMKARLEKHYK